MKSVLFISHDASRTGAPILLLSFLRWFKDNVNVPFWIVLRQGGELESAFSDLAPTIVYETGASKSARRKMKRLGFDYLKHRIKRHLATADVSLIYSNTATNGTLLNALSYLNCPVVSHIQGTCHRGHISIFQRHMP